MALEAGADVTAWRAGFVERARGAAGADRRRRSPRQARHRHGAAGHARPGGGRRRRATPSRPRPASSWPALMTHFATADDARRRRLLRAPARALCAAGRGRCRLAIRSSLVHAANSAATLRDAAAHFDMVALRHRRLRHGPVRRGSRRARARAGARAELLRRRRSSTARRARAPATGAASSPGGDASWRCCRSATATVAARPHQQRRRADRRAPLPAGGHREHGQHHGRSRARSRRSAPGAEAVLIGADGERAHHRRGGRAGGWTRSTTRSPAA